MFFVPIYILILGGTIIIDYFAGIFIEKAKGKAKKRLLIISLISNIGVLAIFKYYNFLNENLTDLLSIIHKPNPIPFLQILLPIGLSFHTFQAMSYTIEVYRGNQKAEKHFGIYSLYVMFYPQLVAGPIERPQNLLHQFHQKHYFDYNRFKDGLKLMAWGMFKKVVIADRLATFVNPIFDHPESYAGSSLLIASIFFTFQIYCDFSGYSDIAIGSAQCMGFKLMNNFNRPFFSKSIAEFWKRWHISLSTWFKDYVYLPLGGSRVSRWKWYYNIAIVFLLSGIWHGANWTFVVWGALHASFMIIGDLTLPMRKKGATLLGLTQVPRIHKWVNAGTTFALACFAFIFFRAKNVETAGYIISHLPLITFDLNFSLHQIASVVNKTEFILAIISILLLELVHAVQRHNSIRHMLSKKPVILRFTIYNIIILGILLIGIFNHSQFIYFQF
jgi:alginate O-acetyltransferase complex protein AlgI